MKAFFAAVLVLAQFTATEAATCAACATTYTTDRDAASGNPAKCVVLTEFLTCLVTGTSCPLAADKAALISTDATSFSCTGLNAVCTCQKTYFETDQTSGDPAVCTAVTTYYHCLTNKYVAPCDGSSTVSSLATEAESSIPSTCAEKTTVCDCQIAFTKKDVSSDALKCTAITAYYNCLTGKYTAACDGSSTVMTLASDVESDIPSTCAEKTTVCDCQIAFTKKDVSSDALKCTAITAYYHCLTGKTTAACDASSTVSDLATAVESSIPSTCAEKTDTCMCQIEYTKVTATSDALKCTAVKNYLSCLVGKTNVGCDGSTSVKTLAEAAQTTLNGLSSCSKTDVCTCEIAYVTADISTNALRCTATKTLTTCSRASVNNGCGASTTKTMVGEAAQTVFTALTTANCAVTDTCQCEINFNKASITDANKCTSANTLDSCLGAASAVACDGSTTAASLRTTLQTSVVDVLCSTAGLRCSVLVSLLMLMISCLVISP